MLWGLLFLSNSIYFSGAANPNPREAEVRLKVLRQGLAVDMPEQTPGKQKSGRKCFGGVWRCTFRLISASRGLLWHVHRQTPPKHFEPDFCFPGVCSGMSTPKPRRSTFSHSQIGNVTVLYMLRTGLRITSRITDSTLWGF